MAFREAVSVRNRGTCRQAGEEGRAGSGRVGSGPTQGECQVQGQRFKCSGLSASSNGNGHSQGNIAFKKN